MKKKLITVRNLQEYTINNSITLQENMIITPEARDRAGEQGIVITEGLVHKSQCSNGNEYWKLKEKAVEILVKEFDITDIDKIQKILLKMKF